MRTAERGEPARLDGRDLRIGIVQARFNIELTDAISRACSAELVSLGVAPGDITHITVPGALEIGAALNALADADDHDALVAIGCVIRGETTHYDTVCEESARGLMDLTIRYDLAIGNGIITVENDDQAWVRAKPEDQDKGGGAAKACLTMVALKRRWGLE